MQNFNQALAGKLNNTFGEGVFSASPTKALTRPYFIVEKASGGGFQHRNVGAPQSWIIGTGQTCRWYKLKRDAVARANVCNTAAH